MKFEWDENKNRENQRKHGISFNRAVRIFEGPRRLEKVDDRRDYGEERIAALGRSEGKILYVVYTWWGDVRRIISARRATKDERRAYLAIYP